MGVINASYNGIATFDPTVGNDGVLIESTGGQVSFPLKTDGKYMFVGMVYNTTEGNDIHFNVVAGESSMGAWQNGRGDIHLYAVETTRDVSTNAYRSTGAGALPYHVIVGPFESARVVRAATAASTALDMAVGDPCVRFDFIAVNSSVTTAAWPSSDTSTSYTSSGDQQTASVEVKLFKLPEVEYTT